MTPTSQQVRTKACALFKTALKALRDGELDNTASNEVKFAKATTVAVAKHPPRGPIGTDESEKAMSDFDLAIQEQRFAQKMFPEAKSVGEALAKWYATENGKKVAATFARDVYERQQKATALGNGYGQPLGPGSGTNWNGATGNGVGVMDRTQGGGVYSQSAADSQQSPSPFGNPPNAVDKKHPALITKANIERLQKVDPKLTFDQAATMLSRGGK
jgi:hypothetical protein